MNNKTEVIKPQKEAKESKNLLTPVIYLILGVLLTFNNDAVFRWLFYILGIIIILYGIKSFITYYQKKEELQYKNINLTVSVASIIIGILLIVLAGVLEISIRYLLGFFLIFMGVTRLLTSLSEGTWKSWNTLSNIILIILGIYSIFWSNVVFVIIGIILIINSLISFWEYFKRN